MEAFRVIDNFCAKVDEVRQSALESGFGTWRPNKGEVGSSIYEGMSFWGKHSLMLRALAEITVAAPFPNNMFFRVTNEGNEKAYVHSDRQWGGKTCIAYLSKHETYPSGTAFFRHRATGLTEMPTLEYMRDTGILEQMKKDMVDASPDAWEQYDFVKGVYNRALIFHAPLFHSRFPRDGIGKTETDGRMVWVCHYCTMQPGGGF